MCHDFDNGSRDSSTIFLKMNLLVSATSKVMFVAKQSFCVS